MYFIKLSENQHEIDSIEFKHFLHKGNLAELETSKFMFYLEIYDLKTSENLEIWDLYDVVQTIVRN